MNPEEMQAYLESLYGKASKEEYQKDLRKNILKEQQEINDWDLAREEQTHDKGVWGKDAATDFDYELDEESERLGAIYVEGSQYNQENLADKQGTFEQVQNAGTKFLWNTIYDTAGGFVGMADIPGYLDPNNQMFKEFQLWNAEQKKAANERNPIYLKENAGMYGPGATAWWIENGSGLASSATSFMLQGAGLGKAMQGAKWLANINSINKIGKVGRRGTEMSTGLNLGGKGLSGNGIDLLNKSGDFTRNLASSIALNQSAALMSAAEVYQNSYDKAINMGYGEDYAKRIAAQSASTTVNMSRANIMLNMTAANKFLGGSKNINGYKPEKFLNSIAKEGGQEIVEENIELIAQKQAEQAVDSSLKSGNEAKSTTETLLSGNVYGDASYKEIAESSVLGFVGGAAQTGLTKVYNKLGSDEFLGGRTAKMFGNKLQETYKNNEYYADGSIKNAKGDLKYETEDVMVENDEGELVPDLIKSKYIEDGNENVADTEVRQQLKLDENGKPIPIMENRNYSQEELDDKAYNKQKELLDNFKDNIEKNARVISTIKYQAQLDKTIGTINDVIDNSKGSLSKSDKNNLIDELARIEMVNSGTVDFDTDEKRKELKDKKEELATSFDSMNERDLRKKQDELLEFSLARTAIESFENNTKDHLIASLKTIKDLTPEQAKEKGYSNDYASKVDESIEKVDSYYNRWMEYNSKNPGHIARALFNNRLKYDMLGDDITSLNEEAKAEHDKAIERHSKANDIDITSIDENGISNKNKYDKAFDIEKDRQKALQKNRKLSKFDKEKSILQEELTDLIQSNSDSIDESYKESLVEINERIQEIEQLEASELSELNKKFDDKIKDLGFKSFSVDAQAKIYKNKLTVVNESIELDKSFDRLASNEGQRELERLEYDKALVQAKDRIFRATAERLMKSQNEDNAGIYWGDSNVAGKIIYNPKTGNYMYQTFHEDEFITLSSNRDFYENQLIPGSEEDIKAFKKKKTKSLNKSIDSANERISNNNTKLTELNERLNPVRDLTQELSSKLEDSNLSNTEILNDINRTNKLLGKNEVSGILTDKELNSLRKKSLLQLQKGWDSITKLIDKEQGYLDKNNKKLKDLENSLSDIQLDDKFKLYKVKDNVDGSITVTRNTPVKTKLNTSSLPASGFYHLMRKDGKTYPINPTTKVYKGAKIYDVSTGTPVLIGKAKVYKGVKGAKSYTIELKKRAVITQNVPITVKLDYDQLNNLGTLDEKQANNKIARDLYIKNHVENLIKLNNINTGKIKLLNGNTETIAKNIEIQNEIANTVKDLVGLRNHINDAVNTGNLQNTIDFSDPVMHQFNSIIAQFYNDQNDVVSEEAVKLKNKIDSIKDEIVDNENELVDIDEEILQIKKLISIDKKNRKNAFITEQDAEVYKESITKLNDNKKKAQKLKYKLNRKIKSLEKDVAMYETYAQLVENSRQDINFVKAKLNELAIPVNQLNNDIQILEDVLTLQYLQVQKINSSIEENKSLRDKLLDILKSPAKYLSNVNRLDELEIDIEESFGSIFNNPSEFNERLESIFFNDTVSIESIQNILTEVTNSGNTDDRVVDSLQTLLNVYEEYNKLTDQNEVLLNDIEFISNEDVFSKVEELERNIQSSINERTILESFMDIRNDRIKELQSELKKLDKINGGTIELLSTIDNKLSDNKLELYTNLTGFVNDLDDKIESHAKVQSDLVKNSNDLAKEIDELNYQFESLLNYAEDIENDLEDLSHYGFDEKTNQDAFKISEVNNKPVLLNIVESELLLLKSNYEQVNLELDKLTQLIQLEQEISAGLQADDVNFDLDTLEERRNTILSSLDNYELSDKLNSISDQYMTDEQKEEQLIEDEEPELTTEDEIIEYTLPILLNDSNNIAELELFLTGYRKDQIKPLTDEQRKIILEFYNEVINRSENSTNTNEEYIIEDDTIKENNLDILNYELSKQRDKLKSFEEQGKRLKADRQIIKDLFDSVNPELAETIDNIVNEQSTVDKAKEKELDSQMTEGDLEESNVAKLVEEKESFQRGKDTTFSTTPRHIIYDSKNKSRKYQNDLPRLTQNEHDLRYSNFLNKFNGAEISNQYKIEFVSLSNNGKARNESDPLNSVQVIQVNSTGETEMKDGKSVFMSALDADIQYGGIYAVIVDKVSGERVYMNSEGNVLTGSKGVDTEGYEPIFSTIPNIRKNGEEFSMNLNQTAIVNKLGGASKGYTKVSDFGNTVKFRGKEYYTWASKDKKYGSVQDLALAVRTEIMRDNQAFRSNILNAIDKGKVYSNINNLSQGDLLRRKDNKLKSASFLFDEDVFDKIVRTKKGKGSDNTFVINGETRTLVSGVPYILTKSGDLIDVESKKLDNADIDLIMNLIAKIMPDGDGSFVKSSLLKIINTDGTTEESTISLVTTGKEMSDIGLLNKLLNWTGSSKKGERKEKFQVWLNNGSVHFIPKDRDPNDKKGPLRFPVQDLVKYMNGTSLKDLKWPANMFIPKFEQFLKDKRKHVHFKLINSDENLAYLHPEMNNGEIVVKKYKNYNEYLATILETSVLNPNELDKVNQQTKTEGNPVEVNSSKIGKYIVFDENLSDSNDNVIKVSTVKLDNITLKEGDELIMNNVVDKLKSDGTNLYWGTVKVDSTNVLNFKFYVEPEKVIESKTDVKETKVKDKAKSNKTKLSKVKRSSLPVFTEGTEMIFTNSFTEEMETNGVKSTVLANSGTEIKVFPSKTKGAVIVQQKYKNADQLYLDFSIIDSKGKIIPVDKKDWVKYKKRYNVVGDIYKHGSELNTESRAKMFKEAGLGDKITSIQDMIDLNTLHFLPKVYIPSVEGDAAEVGVKTMNTNKIGNEFIQNYIPYLLTRDPKFAEGLSVQTIQDNVTSLTSNRVGENLGTAIEYKSNIKTIKDVLLSKELITDENHKGLVMSLLKDKDLDLPVKMTPHLNINGSYTGKAIELSVGSLLRNDKSPIGLILAHELIHKIDLDKDTKLTKHKERLVEIRDKLVTYLYKTNDTILNQHVINAEGNKSSAIAYLLFNKSDISPTDFIKELMKSNGNAQDLITSLGVESMNSSNEFFANVMNETSLQEFLNKIPMKSTGSVVGIDLDSTSNFKNLFKEFISIVKNILKDLGINLKKGHLLEEVLNVGASHYKENGLFKDLSDNKVEYVSTTSAEIVEEVNIISENTDTKPSGLNLVGMNNDVQSESVLTDNVEIKDHVKERRTLMSKLMTRLGKDLGYSRAETTKINKAIKKNIKLEEMTRLFNLSEADLRSEIGNILSGNTQYSLQNKFENNAESKAYSSFEQNNYMEGFEQLLTPIEYVQFNTSILESDGFSKYLKYSAGINNVQELDSIEENRLLNEYIKVVNNDDSGFEISNDIKDKLDKLNDIVEKYYVNEIKPFKMSKEIEQLSSNYTFNNVQLSQVELTSMTEGMTHFLFDVFREYGDVDAFFAKSINLEVVYNKVRDEMNDYFADMLELVELYQEGKDSSIDIDEDAWMYSDTSGAAGIMYDMLATYDDFEFVSDEERSNINDKINNIIKIKNAFFSPNPESNERFKELVKMHSDSIISLGFSFSEDSIDNLMFENENEAVKDKAFFDNSTERNQKDNVPKAIKLLIGSLVNQKVNYELSNESTGELVYENEVNYLGLPKPNEFNDIYNLIVKKLANVPGDVNKILSTLEDVMNEEQSYSNNGSTLRSLLDSNSIIKKLYNDDGSVNTNITLNELNMLVQFMQTFTKFSPKFMLSQIDNKGMIHHFDANKQKTSDKVLAMWKQSFKSNLKDITVLNEEGKRVEIKGISSEQIADFVDKVSKAERLYSKSDNSEAGDKQKINALKDLKLALSIVGLDIQNIAKLNDSITKEDSNIFSLLTNKNSIVDKFKSNMNNPLYDLHADESIKGTIKKLAELVSDTSNQAVDNQFISIDGKTIYAATLNNFLSVATNSINYAINNNQNVRQEVPHLFNAFTNNSVTRKWLEDGNVNVELGMFNGMVAQGQSLGTVTKSLESPDRWAMLLSSTMGGMYTFYRAADRGIENYFTFRDKDTKAIKKLYHDGPAGVSVRDTALESYYGYLLDEVNSMVEHRYGLGRNLKYYSEKGADFRFFADDKISSVTLGRSQGKSDLRKIIKARIEKGDSFDQIKKYLDTNKGNIIDSITESFVNRANEVKKNIKQEGLLDLISENNKKNTVYQKLADGKYKVTEEYKTDSDAMYYQGISYDLLKPYITFDPYNAKYSIIEGGEEVLNTDLLNPLYDEALNDLLLDFTLLQTGAHIEQSKLFTGDPAMYKNSDGFFKRMSMMNSTKMVSVNDPKINELLNIQNSIEVQNDGKVVNFNFTKDELIKLIDNKYVLDKKVLSKKRLKELTTLSGNTELSQLDLVPMLGFNPDYIQSGEVFSDSFKSIILEEVVTQSELAVDQVTKTDFIDGKFVYYKGDEDNGYTELDSNIDSVAKDVDGNIESYAQVSRLRKVFTEAFYKDMKNLDKKVPFDYIYNKVNSYLRPYLEMEEADAQAYVTLAGYKEILLKAGEWTTGHESAYRKAIIGKELSVDEVFLFRVLKTQYTGPMTLSESSNGVIQNGSEVSVDNQDKNLFVPTGYKHSVFPLIPSLIKGTNLEKLNEVLSKKGASLAQFTTSNKFGRKLNESGKSNNVYNEDGSFALDAKDDILSQETEFKYFGVQLSQAPKMKNNITASTQFRKLVLSNLIESGVPTDYYNDQIELLKSTTEFYGKPIKYVEQRVKDNWSNMSDSEKLEVSPSWSLFTQYQDVQKELFKRPFDKLVKELELTITKEGDDVVGYTIGNRSALAKIALEMAKDRNSSINVQKSIASLEQDSVSIEQILSKDKVENVLFAIVNSRVVREKRKGEGSPQVASSMFEMIGVKRESKTGENKFSSPDLRHYIQGKNGKTLPAHAMIALPKNLNAWMQDKYGSLDKLNEYLISFHEKLDSIEIDGDNDLSVLDKDEKALLDLITIIGFRIPNQGINSNENMRVKRFLPTMAGDSIVVPTEMVAKAGSDYDIDKLNIYLKNYIVNKKDKSFIVNNFNDESTDQDLYVKYIFDSVSRSKIQDSKDQMKIVGEDEITMSFSEMLQDLLTSTDTKSMKSLLNEFDVKVGIKDNADDYNFSVAKNLAKTEKLITFNKFSKLSAIEKSTVSVLQNKMIDLHKDILSLNSNYRQLMAPIDDAITKDQADEIRGMSTIDGFNELYSDNLLVRREEILTRLLGKEKGKAIKSVINSKGEFITKGIRVNAKGKVTLNGDEIQTIQVNLTEEANLEFMLQIAPIYYAEKKKWNTVNSKKLKNKVIASVAYPEVNMNKFVDFLSGKAGVGQTAVHITHHQLAMAANLQYTEGEKYWIFDHNQVDGRVDFSGKKDQNGEWTSETLSAFLNAYVDIAADPYVFTMNATNRTANMIFMMLRGGANISWITRFISQPIVKKYIQNQKKNESMFNKVNGFENSKKDIVAETLKEFGVVVNPKSFIYYINEENDTIVEKGFRLDQALKNHKGNDVDPNQVITHGLEPADYELFINNSPEDFVSKSYSGTETLNSARWEKISEYVDNGMFTEERLNEYILTDTSKANGIYSKQLNFLNKNDEVYGQTQMYILDMFLEYQRQSKDFQAMIRATSADTKGNQKNMDDNKSFQNEVDLVKFKNRFENLDNIYKNSIVSEVHNVVKKSTMMFKDLYYFENNTNVVNAKTKLLSLVESSMSLNSDKRSKLRTSYNNDLTTALVTADIKGVDETGKKVVNEFSPAVVFNELFISNEKNTYFNKEGNKAPLAEVIFEMNSSKVNEFTVNKDGDNIPSVLIFESLRDNDLIKELLGVNATSSHKSYNDLIKSNNITSLAKFSTLQSRSRKMDVTKENKLRNAFIEIKEFDAENDTNLYKDLLRIAFNQSGIHHNSPITYSKLIPNEDVKMYLMEAFDVFDNLSDKDQVKVLSNFNTQFLSRNLEYVPDVKTVKRITGFYALATDPRTDYPFLKTRSWNDETKILTLKTVDKVYGTIPTKEGVKEIYRYYPKVTSTSSLVGHGRFLLGYDLNLGDNYTGQMNPLDLLAQELDSTTNDLKESGVDVDNMTTQEILNSNKSSNMSNKANSLRVIAEEKAKKDKCNK